MRNIDYNKTSMSVNDTSSFELLDAKTYLADLVKSIRKAKKRIALISLILTEDHLTHELIDAIEKAAKRGVTVTIATDVFAYGEFGGYISPFQRFTTKSRGMTSMASRLRLAGVSFTWLGHNFKLNPFGGVTHLKWAIVDNTTYCFGGVNLYDFGIESIDYMFRSSQPELAEKMYEQHEAITTSQTARIPYQGFTSEGKYGTIYIDSGKRYESPIYDRLIELTTKASHILVVTQYCPSGLLASRLKGKSDVFYNQPSKTAYPAKALIQYGAMRTGLLSQYKGSRYLHAKFMIFTMPGGKKVAMTGSHNFSYSGVMFGTKEVSLETDDSSVIKQLEEFHSTHVL